MANKKEEPLRSESALPADDQIEAAGKAMVTVEVVRDSGYDRDGVHYTKGQKLKMPEYAVKRAESTKPPFVKRVK